MYYHHRPQSYGQHHCQPEVDNNCCRHLDHHLSRHCLQHHIVGGIACDNQKCYSLEDQGHKAPCMHCHEDQSEIQSGIF